LRTAFEKYRTDAELQFKYFAEVLGAEVEEAKIVGSATASLVQQKRAGNEQTGTQGNGKAAEDEPATAGDIEAA
jgi:hypothetical protein